MPGALIERPKMTRAMYQALKRHIMREREKKKQEQKQDEALERMKKEQEQRKKKEEEDTLTMEQTKEQVLQLERRFETLKQEKHELFSELKKVLHQEDESKKKQQLRENELLSQQYAGGMPISGHPLFLQGGIVRQQSSKYLNPIQQQSAIVPGGIKRSRSPSPPPGSGYTGYGGSNPNKYPATSYPTTVKQETYPHPKPHSSYSSQPATHVTYVTQPGHTYQQQQNPPTSYSTSQSGNSTKYPAGQSAFTSYPSHYAQHQKQVNEPPYPHGYQVQRVAQPGYLNSPHTTTSLPLQQQLEHANQKSGFSDEKFKLQQAMRSQGAAVLPGQIPTSAPPPSQKGSIMTGYPMRTQAPTSTYQTTTTQSTHSSTQGATRTSYSGGQQPSRYY